MARKTIKIHGLSIHVQPESMNMFRLYAEPQNDYQYTMVIKWGEVCGLRVLENKPKRVVFEATSDTYIYTIPYLEALNWNGALDQYNIKVIEVMV